MAETSGPGTNPAVGFLFSLSLEIGDSPQATGTKDEKMPSTTVAVFYHNCPTLVTKAVKDALRKPGLEVRNITCPDDSKIITVELVFHGKDIFKSFENNFKWENVKTKLEQRLKGLGFRGRLKVTIGNKLKEGVDKKMEEKR